MSREPQPRTTWATRARWLRALFREVAPITSAAAAIVALLLAMQSLSFADRQTREQTRARISATQPLLVARTELTSVRDLLPNDDLILANEGRTSALDVVAAVVRAGRPRPQYQVSSIPPGRTVKFPVPGKPQDRIVFRYTDARRERLWTLVVTLVGGSAPCFTIDNQATIEDSPDRVLAIAHSDAGVLAAWATPRYQERV